VDRGCGWPHPRVRYGPLPSASAGGQTHGVGTRGGPDPSAPRWLRVAPTATTVLVAGSVLALVLRGRGIDVLYARWVTHNAPVALVCMWLGAMVLSRRPGHRSGGLLMLLGAASALHVAAISLADARLVAAGVPEQGSEFVPFAPADLPLDASVPMWASTWLWLLAAVPAITLLLLIFPTGAPPSPRWRWVAPVAVTGTITMVVAYAIETWPTSTVVIQMRGQVSERPVATAIASAAGVLVVIGAVASVASLVARWRAADEAERHRIRPMAFTGTGLIVVFVVTFPWQWLWIPAGMVALWIFLGAYALGVVRYRLHDLDVVVNRAVVAAVLAAGGTAAYLAVVVSAGAIAGRGRESTLVPLLAAAVVAVGFEPARRRTRQLVDRLLYGRDRDASQVLSDLADRLRASTSAEDVLDEVAGLLVRSTGADRVEIVMEVDGGDRLAAAHGAVANGTGPLVDVAVIHVDETLGRIRLWARALSDLAPDADELVDRVASTLGVVLRNAALTAELESQVAELRVSRLRLLRAQDEARRALERDIHDGAQARLVALRIKLGIAGSLADAGRGDAVRGLLDELGGEVDESVRALRALGRGLHPPVLEGAGIAAALRAEARVLPMAVTVEAEGVGRYDPAVEAAVYFSCLEAVQNAAKHGRARAVAVHLANGADDLTFSIADDGCGFDPACAAPGSGLTNMRDRIGSLGGHLTVEATPGHGVRIRGTVPALPAAPRDGAEAEARASRSSQVPVSDR
jgi:two-component system, NarL family, sensor kinase